MLNLPTAQHFILIFFFYKTSYESGIKELSAEFRVRLQEELTQREAVEKQLDKQNGLKSHMELSIANLEADVEEKQVNYG